MSVDTARVDEVAADKFRVNVPPAPPVTISFCLIQDEQPALVEGGFNRVFPLTLDVVIKLRETAD